MREERGLGEREAWAVAAAMPSSLTSMPKTVAPILARDSERRPPPQPTSRIFKPWRGLVRDGSLLKWLHKVDLMNWQRVGCIWWSGRNGPLGSHQSSASLANFSDSAWLTVDADADASFIALDAARKL